jgi:tRNA modification GTPase
MQMFDTIAAISTANGEGGIGIVRISGDRALEIADKIFSAKNKKNMKNIESHTVTYGNIVDGEITVDEVLITVLKSPRSYTTEDMVEINCHGGFLVTHKVLETVLKYGARAAENGEFTKRAFMNGRIDLTQAEAVIDLITAKTEKSISVSVDQLRGDLREQISHLKKLLLDVAAHVNVVIDYPEEGIEEPIPESLINNLKDVHNAANTLIKSYDKGKKIKEGIKTAILGRPNVGKSSLLNALLKEERAIVTHIPGTTRDIIEEVINLNGIPLVLVDTAGIRKTEDIVENIGVEKSKDMIEKADMILFVTDSSMEETKEDLEIYEKIKDKNVIGILNKSDLTKKLNENSFVNIKNWIFVSAKNSNGIVEMEDKIYNYIIGNEIENSSEKMVITNIRHKTALEKTKESIENIFETIDSGYPMDLVAVDLREALDSLSEITGEISTEDLLDHVFKNFCVGK